MGETPAHLQKDYIREVKPPAVPARQPEVSHAFAWCSPPRRASTSPMRGVVGGTWPAQMPAARTASFCTSWLVTVLEEGRCCRGQGSCAAVLCSCAVRVPRWLGQGRCQSCFALQSLQRARSLWKCQARVFILCGQRVNLIKSEGFQRVI